MKKLLQSLFLLLFVASQAIAQERTVTGTVTAQEDGLPLPGVGVVVTGTQVGTQTGVDGKFTLKVATNSKSLTFSYIGYTAKTVNIGSGSMNVVLSQDLNALDEVVITAGGVSIQRREQGNQATTIKAAELTQAKAFNVGSALTGKVAGLQVNAVSSGVNPSVRLVLRGNRSLLGNNQALVVVDNVIVPTNILGSINPEDIEDIQVLNGAGAASLYGSDASNGALLITTKKGKKGVTKITAGQVTNFETVAFLPQLQKRFGSGTGPDDVPSYTAFENQQYGPEFDGSMVEIGKPLVDGSIQTVPYSWTGGKNDFWETGASNQTDISLSSGDEKGSYYVSGQYFNQKATVPGDKYNRFSFRVNGTRDLGHNLNFDFNTNYVQNRYDQSSDVGNAFTNVLMSPGQIPLTRYSDWENDAYSSPNGYYNEYYPNPYFTLANNRRLERNDYLTGNAQLKWSPITPLSFLFRVGLATKNQSTKGWTDKFTYSDYRLGITSNFANITGGVNDGSGFETRVNPEFQAQYINKLSKDFSLNVILGASARDDNFKVVGVSSSNMVQGGLYNIANTTGNSKGSESLGRMRQMGVYADTRIGFRDFVYLHVSGRNDWRSVLAKDNRSFFYPAADLSFIASDVVPFLKNSETVNSLKLRGGISKVGLVNIGPYSLVPTFGQQYGYPYNGIPGFGIGDRIVAPALNPEITQSQEAGFDLEMFRSRMVANLTVYQSQTTDQTIPVQIASTTGYTSFLTNTGEVENKGLESALRIIPIRTASGFEVTIGTNYTYNRNKVVSLSDDQDQLTVGTFGNASIVAAKGQPFPLLQGTTYNRDPQGRIIVDAITGFPSVSAAQSNLGNTEPRHRLGLDGTISFKGLQLATVFEYRDGYVMYNGASTGFDFSGAGVRTTYFNRERFVVPNSSYLDPATNTYVENTNVTTRTGGVDFWTNGPSNTAVAQNYTYSAAFWKMRELSITYDIPRSLLKNVGFISGARIGLQGRNLFLFAPKTNIYTDPEYSAFDATSNAIGFSSTSQTPPGRFFGFNLSVTL
jgi:TonB-linked SusC/RagA family outer membrane protein